MPFYAVARGNVLGTFETWSECQISIKGYSGARYKKFNTKEDAENFINDNRMPDNKIPDIVFKEECPDTDYIVIYTDGSCIRKNGESYAGYGIYIPDKNIKKSYILDGKKTNNRGELSAIIDAIEMFSESRETGLHIYTDSDYSIKIFGETGEKYRLKNYKKSGDTEFPNSDLVRKALLLREDYIIKFTHVNSHTGNTDIHSIGNDIADSLAVKGAVRDYISSIENIGESVVGFGIHKNKKISTISKEYLGWVATNPSFEKMCVKNEQLRLEKELIKRYLELLE